MTIRPSTMGSLPPIAVDLDGTLINSDTLHEGVISGLKLAPLKILALAQSLRIGKAAVKRGVAESTSFNPALLPYNQELLAWLLDRHAAGQRIGLFTAADQSIADSVAAHLGFFDVVRGSDGVVNLSGVAKADAIEAAFGRHFSYAGDGDVDLPIFLRATSVILVGPVQQLRSALPEGTVVEAEFPRSRANIGVWARALRLPHWSKNSLVFIAPILGNQLSEVLLSLVLFVLMGLLASGTYVLNDLMDLNADRMHEKKRLRPFAHGTIPIRGGVIVAIGLIGISLLSSLILLPLSCTISLGVYLVITLLYSLFFKRLAMIDVTVLAGLFTLRVLMGSLLGAAPVSPWLLTFSMLFFLGLATIKRYAELSKVGLVAESDGTARGYTQQDIPILLTTGVSSGISAIVIFMIYLVNEQYPRSIYNHPIALWGIMPILLVWTLRIWHLAVHGRMNEDPVVFALKDWLSLAAGGLIGLILMVARL